MHTREARRWLRAEPKARRAAHYDHTTDTLTERFVPQLCGRDVAVIGRDMDFATEAEAIHIAKLFQKDVKKNHPEAAE